MYAAACSLLYIRGITDNVGALCDAGWQGEQRGGKGGECLLLSHRGYCSSDSGVGCYCLVASFLNAGYSGGSSVGSAGAV